MSWHREEAGAGRPLVLLHGIGLSSAIFAPLMAPLADAGRRVLAFDLPGFGRSRPLGDGIEPSCENLADALLAELQALGIAPGEADVVGSSLGGLIALHAGCDGTARTVVALSPTGLWHDHAPPHTRLLLRAMRLATDRLPSVAEQLVRFVVPRTLCLAIPMSPCAWRIPANDAARATQDFAGAAAFEPTLKAVAAFRRGDELAVPTTVAFGQRDWLLTSGARCRNYLPGHVRWLEPPGWGHVPIWDDVEGVARVVLEGTA